MQQVLLSFGPIMVKSMNVLLAIGFFFCFYVIGKLAQKNRLRLQFLINIAPSLLFGALLSGRLFAILDNYQLYFNQLNIQTIFKLFSIWDQDISFWGAIFGFSYVFIKNCQVKAENVKKWADVLMVGLITILFFRNIGHFLEGTNYGHPTKFFLGVTFNSPNIIYTDKIHPTQLYATFYTLIIAGFLYWTMKKYKNQFEGLTFILGAFLFSLFRFLEGFFRGDDVLTVTSLKIRASQIVFFGLFLYFSKKLYIYQIRNKVPILRFYEKLFGKIFVQKK